MSDHSQPPDLETLLNQLATRSVGVDAHFAERTVARLKEIPQAEAMLEEWIDAELSRCPVEASANFTERTLARARSSEEATRKAPLLQFSLPLWSRAVAGIAAALALLLPLQTLQVADQSPSFGEDTIFAATAPELDPANAKLLLLAQGLHGSGPWIHDGEAPSSTLLALAR